MKYVTKQIDNDIFVVYEVRHDYERPAKSTTFAFDTENIVLVDNEKLDVNTIYDKLKNANNEEKRRRLESIVWAWQCYDEVNGFFMTNDFDTWLTYQCRCGYKTGWCYNAKFDFSQIDYKILAEQVDKWKPYEKSKGKGQKYAYNSLHNDMGQRYCYKLWYPYRKTTKRGGDRHLRVHSLTYLDFMNFMTGGLSRILENLDVRDENNQPIRKLSMDYQAVNIESLTEEEIEYCCVDVKGLYYAVKQFDEVVRSASNDECNIFDKPNIMTAGGFAKKMMLMYMYPNSSRKFRLENYQNAHPITLDQDRYVRDHGLYRGGICLVNPKYKGRLITQKMYRYDVNSEYPFAMYSLQDLVGEPFELPYDEYLKMSKDEQEKYECIMVLESAYGALKPGRIGFWFDISRHTYTDYIDEDYTHLIFKRELEEYENFYDIEYKCDIVILIRRGGYVYRDFIDYFYKLKNTSKKEGNKVMQALAKLILNSAYGKLSERVERHVGVYELNEDTGAIHYVDKGLDVDETGMLNVINGALVTAFARCYILSKIRETCGEETMIDNFIYIDTDSIHSLSQYKNPDAYTLGGLKLEAKCVACKYIAPKTYIDIEEMEDNKVINYEAHTKGINVSAVNNSLDKTSLTLEDVDKLFNYGSSFIVLSAMNVKGGKVLIPVSKYLAREELAPNEIITSQLGETIINER